jgi:hypothetical protein
MKLTVIFMSRSSTAAISESSLPLLSELDELSRRLEAVAERLINGDILLPVNALPFPKLLTPLVKLYAAASEAAGIEFTPVTQDTTATEVVMLACGLLRAQNLNPFDLALWFSRAARTSPLPPAELQLSQEKSHAK